MWPLRTFWAKLWNFETKDMKTLFYCVACTLMILSAEAPIYTLIISVVVFLIAAKVLSDEYKEEFQDNKD
ncbi:MAG: hypothetical protein J6X92_02805 [Bacteroidales bacterium]|nr:hypothetical protein [Bacteroidales bacterium]